ncbi:AI-2E family transporter [Flavobacterium aquicola]|uniref:Putative PurR-regulated permease PerM n=1 Tax=Flavobacterium aquicola TaxID=1682742 RepID=A0A3E0ER39_9FLAO|nr:AI-2E family transporter [Flavobacterium aquicola]REG99616.1 putative PurR-regulated permease PerM [Flavobacterium aquicola]
MITSKIISNGIIRAVAVLILVALVLYFLFQIQNILIYLLVSLILTLIGTPILDFLKKKLKFKHTIATITVLSIYFLLILGFIMMFIPLIISQGQNLSLLNTAEIERNSLELIQKINIFLEQHHIDAAKVFNPNSFKSFINFNTVPNFLNSVIGTISGFGMGFGSVLFITFFFLKDRSVFLEGAKLLIPDSHEEKILNSAEKINLLLSRYFIGLLVQLFIVFILYTIVLFIFGIPNALVIAFLCAVLNIIPYLGPLIASVFAAVLTMLSNLGSDFQSEILPTTIYVLIGFWIVQLIDNNFSQPIIFSKSVSSHPLEIFLVILIAGFSFGILGMIIAVPLYTILKVICKEFFPDNEFIQNITKNI